MMDLNTYLKRIAYHDPVRVDLATLQTIHHQHLLHIPYENGDVQLGTPLDFDPQRIYQKLVVDGRGGWCYEMNGLLGWALAEIGFPVTRMSGAVMRETEGDVQLGNHLVLEVRLDDVAYLADVGLGDGLRYPIPIVPGEHTQAGLSYGLSELTDGYWRFHNHAFSHVQSFDFRHQPANEAELAAKCSWLQQDPSSPFKMMLIMNRFTADSIEILLGKVRTTTTARGKQSYQLETLAALHEELRSTFGLDLNVSTLWPAIEAAHEQYLSATEPRTP